MPRDLSVTATVTVRELTEEVRGELVDLDLYPLAQIVEVLDERTCPLCEYVDGMTLDRRDPASRRWLNIPHINCRRVIAYISADEVEIDEEGRAVPARPDFVEPPAELIDKYGHFVRDPHKYEALRIPAQPEGCDFVVRWKCDRRGRRSGLVVCWRIAPYDLPGLPGYIEQQAPGNWDASLGPEWRPGDPLDEYWWRV